MNAAIQGNKKKSIKATSHSSGRTYRDASNVSTFLLLKKKQTKIINL